MSVASLVWTLDPRRVQQLVGGDEHVELLEGGLRRALVGEVRVRIARLSVVGSPTNGSSTPDIAVDVHAVRVEVELAGAVHVAGGNVADRALPGLEGAESSAPTLSADDGGRREHRSFTGTLGRKVPARFSWCRYGRSRKYALNGRRNTSAVP